MSVNYVGKDLSGTEIFNKDGLVATIVSKKIQGTELYICQDFAVADPEIIAGLYFVSTSQVCEEIEQAHMVNLVVF